MKRESVGGLAAPFIYRTVFCQDYRESGGTLRDGART